MVRIIVGKASGKARPTRLAPLRVRRERPYLEAAAFWVVAIRPDAVAERIGVHRQHEEVREHEDLASPQPHPFARGRHWDAGAAGVLEQGCDRCRREVLSRRHAMAQALEDPQIALEDHGVLTFPEDPVPLDELVGSSILAVLDGNLVTGPLWSASEHASPRGIDATLEAGMAVFERGVLGDPRRIGLALTHRELGVGPHHVPALVEGLLGRLPVGAEDGFLPPPHTHVAEPDRVEERGHW